MDFDFFGQMPLTCAKHTMLLCERVDLVHRYFISRIAVHPPHPRRYYSSNSAASAFRLWLPYCFFSNIPLSPLHVSTRDSYSSLLPNLSNDSSRTSSREIFVFLSFRCSSKCAFLGSQSSMNVLYISLFAIRFRSLAFSSPPMYLSLLKNRHSQTYLYIDSALSKGLLQALISRPRNSSTTSGSRVKNNKALFLFRSSISGMRT